MDQDSTKTRKYTTTIVITSDKNPKTWDLENFRWAIENGEAEEISRKTEREARRS